MGLGEILKKTLKPGARETPSFDDEFVRAAILEAKGKSYYDTFSLRSAESLVGENEVYIRPEDEDILIGYRHNDGIRDFNTPEARYHIDPTGKGFNEAFVEEYKHRRKTGLIAAIDKDKRVYDEQFPILMDVYSVLLDSIVRDGKRLYSRDMQEPMVKFIDAERFVSAAIDALDDPRVLESMIFQEGDIKNTTMEEKLKNHASLKNPDGNLDPGKVKQVLGNLAYLSNDHERQGKDVYLSEEGKTFVKKGLLKGIFGKNKWFQVSSPLKAVEHAYHDAIQDLKYELDAAFNSSGDRTISGRIWSILGQKEDGKLKPKEKRIEDFQSYAKILGKDVSRFLEDHYRGERTNTGPESVRYADDGMHEQKPISVDKIRGFSQLVDEFDKRSKAFQEFKENYLSDPEKGSVYSHIEQVVNLSPYSRAPKTSAENPNKKILAQIQSNLGHEWEGLERLMKGTRNKEKVVRELNKRMAEVYVEARNATYEANDLPIQDKKVFGLPSYKKMDDDVIDGLWKTLMFSDYTGNPADKSYVPVKRFAAYRALSNIIQVP